MIVADLGCFRVQILDENGSFVKQFSLLSGPEQIEFQHDKLGILQSVLLKGYAAIKTQAPILLSEDLNPLFNLATSIHPTSPFYSSITSASYEWRALRARYHHPSAADFLPSSREIAVSDLANGNLHLYSLDGSRCLWLATSPMDTMKSVHSCVEVEEYTENQMTKWMYYISDPLANRVAVLDVSSLTIQRFIGASTYGDLQQSSPGYLPGELNHPSYLAVYHNHSTASTILLVSDSGNHCVSQFSAMDGVLYGRIGKGFGHTEGYFDSPQGLTVLNNQSMFVVDQRNHRVQVYNLQDNPAQFIRTFGNLGTQAGKFNFPTAICVCGALPSATTCNFGPHREAKLAVADTGNCRIQVLDLNGLPLFCLSVEQTPLDLPLMPLGICIEQRSGYILVCDSANQCVLIFRNDGSYVSSIGPGLESANKFVRPTNIAIRKSTHDESVLITDSERRQMCKIVMDDNLPEEK